MTIWTAALGYCWVAGNFQPYDDEGYLMLQLRHHLEGHTLYENFDRSYGPAYYLHRIIIHRWLGVPLTHDAVRILTLLHLTLTALFCGLFIYSMTRSTLWSTLGQALVFYHLFSLAREPGHPQEMIALLLALGLFLCAHFREKSPLMAFVLGVTASLLLQMKINNGVFFVAAAGSALMFFLSTSWWSQRTSMVLNLIVIGVGCLMPVLLMKNHLWLRWAQGYAAIASASILSIYLASFLSKREPCIRLPDMARAAAGALAAVVLVMAFMLVEGASLSSIVTKVVLEPIQFSSEFWRPAPYNIWSVAFALFMPAVPIYFWKHRNSSVSPARNMFRVIGIAFLLLTVGTVLFRLEPELFLFGPPFLFLTATSFSEEKAFAFPMFTAGCVAVFQHLQAYPVHGTQLIMATFLFVPLSIVIMWKLLEGYSISGRARQWTASVTSAMMVLGGAAVLASAGGEYLSKTPLRLPGTRLIRLPGQDCAALEFITANLRANSETFYSMPGMNSFYFWADLPIPTTFNAEPWMLLYGKKEQERIIEALDTRKNACILRNLSLVKFWTGGYLKWKDFALADHIEKNYRTRIGIGQYELMFHPGVSLRTVHAGDLKDGVIRFRLVGISDASSVEFYDWTQKKVLYDAELIRMAGADDIQEYRTIWPGQLPSRLPYFLVGRIYDEQGQLTGSVPVTLGH
jgi:hypothetical protein